MAISWHYMKIKVGYVATPVPSFEIQYTIEKFWCYRLANDI